MHRPQILRLAIEHGVDDFYQGVVPALVPFLIAERGYTLAQAGGVALAATLLSSLLQPAFGALADRRPMAWLRSAGMLTAATGVAAVGLVDSYPAVWLMALLSGLGVAAFHPEAARAVHRTGTGDTGMGWFTFAGLTGYAAGPILATAVFGTLGLTASPLLAAPAVIVLLAGQTWGRNSIGTAIDSCGPEGAQIGAPPDDWRRFGVLTTIVVIRSLTYYAVVTFLVVYLTTQAGFGLATATAALTALTTFGALGTLAGGYLARRFSRLAVLGVASLVTPAALMIVLSARNTPMLLLAAAALGVALNAPVALHVTLGQHYLPNHLGAAAGVTLGLAVSVGGLATPGLGALADQNSIRTVLTGIAVLPVVAAGLTLLLRPSQRHQ
ncbi:MAG: MFS transporter [Actinobacteria bacterium]|nr:MFS transporter [Actinomycetota bacterium]